MDDTTEIFRVVHNKSKQSVQVIFGEQFGELSPDILESTKGATFQLLSSLLGIQKIFFTVTANKDGVLNIVSTEQFGFLPKTDKTILVRNMKLILDAMVENSQEFVVH